MHATVKSFGQISLYGRPSNEGRVGIMTKRSRPRMVGMSPDRRAVEYASPGLRHHPFCLGGEMNEEG
jgi:hypothetical protein